MNIMYANLDIDPESPIEEEPTAGDWEDEEDEEELESRKRSMHSKADERSMKSSKK